MCKLMSDNIKCEREKKVIGVHGRTIVEGRGGSSKSDTKRRPHGEGVL